MSQGASELTGSSESVEFVYQLNICQLHAACRSVGLCGL
jgi:hypothetical protein